MKFRSFRKSLVLGLLLSGILLTGCSASQVTHQILQNGLNREQASDSTEASGEKLTMAEIENLAANCIFNVEWYTEDDVFTSGTSFLMDSKVHGEKLLVSAFHYLVPEDDSHFSGSDLPKYITGGVVYNACTFEETGATLKNCLIIEDAAPVPDIDKDVSAFTIQGNDDLKTLPLSTHKVKAGDTVYLLANLWDTDDVHENCVYEATVISDKGGILAYTLDEKYGTNGASGAPVINEYGEVVAIHIGSNGSTRMAHSASSFLEQINNGKVSDITCSADLVSSGSTSSASTDDIPIYEFAVDETIETTFFYLKIDSVLFTPVLEGEAAPNGYQFAIIDVTMDSVSKDPVDMYASDFAVYWGNEYAEPLESGITSGQLPDEYVISDSTSGQLIFLIPDDAELIVFSYLDYYYYGNSNEINYNGFYDIYIPVEDWSRKAL